MEDGDDQVGLQAADRFESRDVTGELCRVTPAFSPVGDLVACAIGKGVVLLSSVTGEEVFRFKGHHTHRITCLAFAQDRFLYSVSIDGTLITWDFIEMKYMNEKKLGREILAMSVSPSTAGILYLALGPKEEAPEGKEEDKPVAEEGGSSGGTSSAPEASKREGEGSKNKEKKAKAKNGDGGGGGGEEEQEEEAAIGEAAAAGEAVATTTTKKTKKPPKQRWKIVEYILKQGKQSKIMNFSSAPFFLQSTANGFVVAACPDRLMVFNVKEKEIYSEMVFDELTPREGSLLQAVAVGPAGKEIATGDIHGRLYIWHTPFQKLGSLPQARAEPKNRGLKKLKRMLLRSEIKRWHSHGVSCLAFTPDGQYLLSGGEEAVLVVCQLGKSNNMTYLPRLGSRITGLALSEDGLNCALTTRGNSLRLAHPMDLRISWEFKGLAHTSTTETVDMSSASHLWAHPSRPWEIISNCFPGKLQFYDLGTESVTREMEIASSNVVSRMESEKLVPPWVTHVALSSDATHLVTVESRAGEENIKRVTLKFWDWDASTKRFGLASVVDRPHESQGHGRLLALAYHPQADLVASSSTNGTFNLWVLVPEDEEGGRGMRRMRWICQATVPFNRGAGRCLSFSADGTLLAVGAGSSLALWDPTDVKLVTVLLDPQAKAATEHEVREVAFIANTPRLVTSTRRTLLVWDLLSLTPLKRYEAGLIRFLCTPPPSTAAQSSLQVHGQVIHFAVALQSVEYQQLSKAPQSLVLFNAFTAEPLLTHHLEASTKILSLALTEGGMDGAASGLCYMTKDQVSILGPPLAIKSQKQQRKRALAFSSAGGGAAAAVEEPKKRPKPSPVDAGVSREATSIADLFGATTGHLPRPSAVFDAFLAGILPRQAPLSAQLEEAIFVLDHSPSSSSAREAGGGKKKGTAASSTPASRAHDAVLMPPPPVALLPPCGIKKDLLKLLGRAFGSDEADRHSGVSSSRGDDDNKGGQSSKKKKEKKGVEAAAPSAARSAAEKTESTKKKEKRKKGVEAVPSAAPPSSTEEEEDDLVGGGAGRGVRRRTGSVGGEEEGGGGSVASETGTPKTRTSKRRASKT